MTRELLYSVTKNDCEWSYTRGTGAGGQKKNKTSSAVHCTHKPSGAYGYSEASRSQADNRSDAFMKMAKSKKFQTWLKVETARRLGQLRDIDEVVAKQMRDIRIDAKVDGRWVELTEENTLHDE